MPIIAGNGTALSPFCKSSLCCAVVDATHRQGRVLPDFNLPLGDLIFNFKLLGDRAAAVSAELRVIFSAVAFGEHKEMATSCCVNTLVVLLPDAQGRLRGLKIGRAHV